MSNEQPPVRDVVPYKHGKRQSTFRKLNIDFSGTALEQAIALQERASSNASEEPDLEPIVKNLENAPTTPHHSPPLPTTPHHSLKPTHAPAKDFNRRANSIERDAMPTGTFPGASKKVYDALYLRTRGAIVPKRLTQASRRDLLEWTGIRNLKTLDNHVKYLMAIGLIIRHWELGSNEGSSYEVVLPEERTHHSPPLPTTLHDSPPVTTSQKMGSGYTQKLGSGGEGQTIENKDTYIFPKTFKTYDDEHTHTLSEFNRVLVQAAQGIVGVELINSEQERLRWKEVGQILADELKFAAQRADTISSVPAFLATHLRRVLEKKTQPAQKEVRANTDSEKPVGTTPKSDKSPAKTKSGSRFSLDECRRYADHLRTAGQGINNPGGYATAVYRSGEADALIENFLNPVPPSKLVDASGCPDCDGTGWWYPKGREMGAAKCKHEKLNKIQADESA
ncbi:MAG: hypothetical protein MSG64_10505 [Pyrinomonadaceae bacterium MAG19_C2-C3]|nr:hypothetical protein [Pyrinomonadaceae bacterium MAG19_C2-C3]